MELKPVARAGVSLVETRDHLDEKRDLPTQVYTRAINTVNYKSCISGPPKAPVFFGLGKSEVWLSWLSLDPHPWWS